MFANVAPRGATGVGTEKVAQAICSAEQIEQERRAPLRAGHRGCCIHILDKPSDQRGEIRRFPFSVQIGFSKANVSGEKAAAEEIWLADHQRCVSRNIVGEAARLGGMCGAKGDLCSVGQMQAEVTTLHVLEGTKNPALGEATRRGGSLVGGHGGGDGRRVHESEGASEAWGR